MDSSENVVRLAKPVKKGIAKILFSRTLIIAILLILQVALLVFTYIWARDKVHILLYIQWIFTFVMVIYLFNSSMDSSAKLTWMLLIAFLPVAGAFMLWWTQANIGHRKEMEWSKGR